MAGRPKSFDMDKALDAFVDVFWTKGYQNTSIDDLQAAAGIKRGSFYATFGSKDDVFATILEKYWHEATELGLSHMDSTQDPRQAVAGLIRHVGTFMSRNIPRGCLLLTSSGNTVSEQTNDAAIARERMGMLEKRIFDTLARDDSLSEDKARDLAAFAVSCLLGLNALARLGQPSDKILAAADYGAGFFETPGM